MKPGEIMMHPLWATPVMLLFMTSLIQGLHTAAHWRMQIDADSYCKNNAEWIESNTGYSDDDY